MSINRITTDDLRRMNNSEGLILQGCGGDLQEWQDGINEILTEENILLNGSKFENCFVFEHKGITCLLFPFEENVKLDTGKLAMWRLQSHATFGGTWLSDYVPNRLGGFLAEQQEKQKPDCPLIGQDGNIFNLMGIASKTLRRNGMADQATEMRDRITQTAGSYYEALGIIGEYVNITSDENAEINENEGMVM
jgi:hypothetical protein